MDGDKKFALGAVSVLIAFIIGALCSGLLVRGHFRAVLEGYKPQVDTLYIKDTIKLSKPTSSGLPKMTGEVLKIPVVPQVPSVLFSTDTARVDTLEVPIVQREFADTNYHAWVSGVAPKLDSIHIYSTTKIVPKITPVYKDRKWNVGLQGGIGAVQPFGESFKLGCYLGVGVQWNF